MRSLSKNSLRRKSWTSSSVSGPPRFSIRMPVCGFLEGGREGGREEGREGGREGGRQGGRDCSVCLKLFLFLRANVPAILRSRGV